MSNDDHGHGDHHDHESRDPSDPVRFLTEAPLVDGAELQRLGYLQEVNRRFFHPLGLAFAWFPDQSGILAVLDHRADPEGVGFAPGMLDADVSRMRADYVDGERASRVARRVSVFGAVVQPLEGDRPLTAGQIAHRLIEAAHRHNPEIPAWHERTEAEHAALTAAVAEAVMPTLSPSAR